LRMPLASYLGPSGRSVRKARLILKDAARTDPQKLYDLALVAEGRGHKMLPSSHDILEDMRARRSGTLHDHGSFRSGDAFREGKWTLKILWDATDQYSPSSFASLQDCMRALDDCGIAAELLRPDFKGEVESDALFIRAYTHPLQSSYGCSDAAERAGLVVMDDTRSIRLCCSKLFQLEALTTWSIPTPDYFLVSGEGDLRLASEKLGFPMVLKTSDGSFSRGVFKVNTSRELEHVFSRLSADHPILIAQKYIPTDFDWRIGVLNGKLLFACRYFMADKHWQIIKYDKGRSQEGCGDSLPLKYVPREVLDVALQASACIGRGLYGVDVKMLEGRPYVIEVNDNPNIESDMEASCEPVWGRLAAYFASAIDQRRRGATAFKVAV